MAKIPLLRDNPKRKRNVISKTDRFKARRKLYNSKEWKRGLRLAYLQKEPLCRCCSILGKVTAGECIHHIKSVTDGTTVQDIFDLGLDESNLVTLCNYHHALLHTLDEFKHREFKTAEDLAEFIKEHPEIEQPKVKLTLDELKQRQTENGKILFERTKDIIVKPVFKFDINGNLINEFNSRVEAQEDGFTGKYNALHNNKFFWSQNKDFKITDDMYKIFAYDENGKEIGRFFSIGDAAKEFGFKTTKTINEAIEEKRACFKNKKHIIFSRVPLEDVSEYRKKKITVQNNTKKVGQFSLQGELVNVYDTAKDAAEKNGVSYHTMISMCGGTLKRLINMCRFRYI